MEFGMRQSLDSANGSRDTRDRDLEILGDLEMLGLDRDLEILGPVARAELHAVSLVSNWTCMPLPTSPYLCFRMSASPCLRISLNACPPLASASAAAYLPPHVLAILIACRARRA